MHAEKNASQAGEPRTEGRVPSAARHKQGFGGAAPYKLEDPAEGGVPSEARCPLPKAGPVSLYRIEYVFRFLAVLVYNVPCRPDSKTRVIDVTDRH